MGKDRQDTMKSDIRKIFEDISFQQFSQVVEMGVGKGTFAIALKKTYPNLNIIVVDKDFRTFKKSCRSEKVFEFKMLKEDVTNTSIPSQSIDCVAYYKLIHHFSPPTILASFNEAHRILKEKGSLLVVEDLPKPQNKAQMNLLKIYEVERKIDAYLNETPEQMYSPSEIINLLHDSMFIIVKEKIYYQNVVSVPLSLRDKMLCSIKKRCKEIKKKQRALLIKEIGEIEREIRSSGLERLPLFTIFARKIQISKDSIPIKKTEVKARVEKNLSVLLYEKEKGILMLNPIGGLMWSMCTGENSITKIAEKVKKITKGETIEKIMRDTQRYFVSLYEKGFVEFKG
ncbi:MAG: PqqD family peptide modification chaperone [Bacteroidales bacterium]